MAGADGGVGGDAIQIGCEFLGLAFGAGCGMTTLGDATAAFVGGHGLTTPSLGR